MLLITLTLNENNKNLLITYFLIKLIQKL